MHKKWILLHFLFLIFLHLCSCKSTYRQNTIETAYHETAQSSVETRRKLSLDEIIRYRRESMSLKERAGLLSMVNIPGQTLDDKTVEFLRRNYIKSVILFKYNIRNEEQLRLLILDLRARVDPEMLIAVDQEGGKVVRIAWEKHAKITPKMIQESKNPEKTAYRVAYERGRYFNKLGVNVILGPVADIPLSKKSFIYKRSFGTGKDQVSRLVALTVKGYQDAGVLSVLKHFPGIGSTRIDSHKDFPVINRTLKELERKDLAPFNEGIKAGAPMILLAHIFNRYVDPELPVSLSPKTIDLLEKLNFKGVVITDDLAMTGKIERGIGWGINIISGRSFGDIEKYIRTIEPVDLYVDRVIRMIYYRHYKE